MSSPMSWIMIQCNGCLFLSFNHEDLVLAGETSKKIKTAKYCKSITDTFTMYSFAFNLAGELDIGYAANNMIKTGIFQRAAFFTKKIFSRCGSKQSGRVFISQSENWVPF